MERSFLLSAICDRFYLNKKITFIFFILFLLPIISRSHSFEDPSFKYSREANEDFKNVDHSHQHWGNGHQHGHDHHGHLHEHSEGNKFTSNIGDVWFYSMASTIFISAVPFLLLFVIPLDNSNEKRPLLKVLLAFASGGLLGDAFLHLIPHATSPHHSLDNSHGHSHETSHTHGTVHSHIHDHNKDIAIGLWVLCGIIAFLTVEKVVRLLKGSEGIGHGHSHVSSCDKTKKKENGDKKPTKNKKLVEKLTKNNEGSVEISGYLNLAADFAHNFTDGLAIGASFLAGNNVGLVTTITILLHEVPHEIGDFAILIKSGCSRRKAMFLQLITAVGALSGNALALVGVGSEDDTAPWVLPFTAGGFIYIATVSVLPELLEESTKLAQSIKEIAALLTGVALMVFIANFE